MRQWGGTISSIRESAYSRLSSLFQSTFESCNFVYITTNLSAYDTTGLRYLFQRSLLKVTNVRKLSI